MDCKMHMLLMGMAVYQSPGGWAKKLLRAQVFFFVKYLPVVYVEMNVLLEERDTPAH